MSAGFDLTKARAIAAALDEKLRPIAKAPLDTSDPNWMEKMRRFSPLDEAGVRPQAEALLLSLLHTYASGPSEHRVEIRELFRKYSSFQWATSVPQSAATAEGFRLRLLQLSVLIGVEDPRELALTFNSLLYTAKSAGLSIEPIAAEVAAVSESPLREILFGMS